MKTVKTSAGLLVDSIEDLLGGERDTKKAALIIGGGVGRQDSYRDTIVDLLRDRGVVFGRVEVVGDVAGEGCLGLVARSKGARGRDCIG